MTFGSLAFPAAIWSSVALEATMPIWGGRRARSSIRFNPHHHEAREMRRQREELERRARFDMKARKELEFEQQIDRIAAGLFVGLISIVLVWKLF